MLVEFKRDAVLKDAEKLQQQLEEMKHQQHDLSYQQVGTRR